MRVSQWDDTSIEVVWPLWWCGMIHFIYICSKADLYLPHTHTHIRLTALCPGLPRWASTRKVEPLWILLKQETVSGSGISWAICKSAPRSRQITMPAPHRSVFTGQMPFLPPSQQRQSTEGNIYHTESKIRNSKIREKKWICLEEIAAVCSLWSWWWELCCDATDGEHS